MRQLVTVIEAPREEQLDNRAAAIAYLVHRVAEEESVGTADVIDKVIRTLQTTYSWSGRRA